MSLVKALDATLSGQRVSPDMRKGANSSSLPGEAVRDSYGKLVSCLGLRCTVDVAF